MLSKADHQRVHDAILAAEQATSGELFCVVAHESGPYRETPFAWAAAAALIAPPLALLGGLAPVQHLLGLGAQDWSSAQAGGAPDLTPVLLAYAAAQAVVFAVALMITGLKPVRLWLTPSPVKQARVHARALEQFAHRAHATSAQTGVLIYASLAERRVQIIADEDIHALAAPGVWDAAVAAALGSIKQGQVADGLIAAIQACGAVLAEHRPLTSQRHAPASGDVWEV